MARQLKRLSEFVPQGSTVGRPQGSKNKRLQLISQAELAHQFASSGLLATPAQVLGAAAAAPIFIPASGLALLSSGVTAAVCSFVLPAGAWDVSGNITFNPNGTAASSFTDAVVAINTSLSLPTGPNSGGYAESTSSMSITKQTTIATAVMRVTVAVPTTIYLLAQATFS